MTNRSDGSTASYYELPPGCTELQDLISHRNMNAQDGEIFRAIYRKGRASHSDELRDAKKVLFYAQAEVKRLEQGMAMSADFSQQHTIEPASLIDDESPRQQAIGQNGNGGEHYDDIEAVRGRAPKDATHWQTGGENCYPAFFKTEKGRWLMMCDYRDGSVDRWFMVLLDEKVIGKMVEL